MKYKTNLNNTIEINPNREINRGGEGTIFLVENKKNTVAKIFHQSKTKDFEKRMQYLKSLNISTFVVPQELIYSKGKLIGYTMEYIDIDYFPIASLFSKNFCIKNNIDYNFKTEIAEKLKSSIENAHYNSVVIGDLNQFNILVNLKKQIKIIDTDSFQTPVNRHTGILLDEIRDYLYNGEVSKKSDYFAYAVILFYMLTFVHPFKGIHKRLKSIHERMKNKISVLKNDKNLRLPKFYEPISDKNILSHFEDIFNNGNRFIFSLAKANLMKVVKKTIVKKDIITENDIIIRNVLMNKTIVDIQFCGEIGYVETHKEFELFTAKNKGYLNHLETFEKAEVQNIFVGYNNILVQKKNKLYQFEDGKLNEIRNFKILKYTILIARENIIIALDGDKMFWLYIDTIFNYSIKIERTEVFGKSFSHINGLIQNTGGVKRIFYNTGNVISSVKIDKNIKKVYQKKNVGIMKYIENNELKQKFFTINGISAEFVDDFKIAEGFDFIHSAENNTLMIVPKERKMAFVKTSDYNTVSEIECSIIADDTKLIWTKAGIIAYDFENVYLLNKKIR